MNSDSTSVAIAAIREVKDGIRELAAALKIPAEHVYDVFTKQVLVDAYSLGFLGFIALLGSVLAFLKHRTIDKKYYEEKRVAWAVFSIGLFIIATIIGVNCFARFMNPEYFAIESIINEIK